MKRPTLATRMKRIRLVAFDCDGVLTDGTIRITSTGREIKSFSVLDGTGIKWLQRAGLQTAILSGRKSRAVTLRAGELGIRHVLQGVKLKTNGLRTLLARSKVAPEEICFVGDDLPDIPVMRRVGLAVAVADARPEVRRIAHWTTRAKGGRGAVREVAEKILKLQSKWGALVARYGLRYRGRLAGEAL